MENCSFLVGKLPHTLRQAYPIVGNRYQAALVEVADGFLVDFLADVECLGNVFGRTLVAQRTMADEATGNLDSKNGLEVMGLLRELHREGTTIVMVTHSARDAAYSDRIVNLFDGCVVDE